jgi:biofilm PGA synthesis N-glycosyltransferase PgaC
MTNLSTGEREKPEDYDIPHTLRHNKNSPTALVWRSMTPLLLAGYFLTISVGCVQVYFLVRAITGLSGESGMGYFQSVMIAFFFFFFSLFFVGRYLVTMLFAFLEGSKIVDETVLNDIDAPLVTILIPCYNEADNIAATIASALGVDYPALEVIVIDDGSTDDTVKLAEAYAANHNGNIKVITQQNTGKASALNKGYKLASGEYILSMDADSELDTQSVRRLVARSIASGAGAVAGQVHIKNTRSMLAYLQQLEYVMMNGTARLFQSFFSSVLVAPGPITLFNRAALERTIVYRNSVGLQQTNDPAGPWETSTFAEDAKLSMTMLASGEACVFEPSAVCLTQAPAGNASLMNQRYRWIRGNLQAAMGTWALWKRASGRKPSLSLWIMWFLIESLIWPLIDVFGVIIIVLVLINNGGAAEGFFWYLALMCSDIAAALFAATACNGRRRLAFLVPFYRLGYGLLLECVALVAFFDESRGGKMKWN